MVAEGGSVELGPALERLELPPEFKLSSMIDCGGLVQMVQQLMLALQKQTDRSDALEATVATMQEEIRRLNCHVAAQAAIQMSNGALLDGYRDEIEKDETSPACSPASTFICQLHWFVSTLLAVLQSECEITGHFFPNSCHLMAAGRTNYYFYIKSTVEQWWR